VYHTYYTGDRIEEVPPGTKIVANKLEAITSQAPLGYKQPPFISENGFIPLGVIRSVLVRHQSLWGRYE